MLYILTYTNISIYTNIYYHILSYTTYTNISIYTIGCQAGTFSNSLMRGASSCTPCPRGTTSDPAASRCNLVCESPSAAGGCCPPGYFSLPNSHHCSPCSPGTYSLFGTVEACILCPVGMYQPGYAMSSCIPCSGASSTNVGASFCSEFSDATSKIHSSSISSSGSSSKSSSDEDSDEEEGSKRPRIVYLSNLFFVTLKQTIKGTHSTISFHSTFFLHIL
jgi:Tyrosine-protein kinase ephrin type A/B receptor-like